MSCILFFYVYVLYNIYSFPILFRLAAYLHFLLKTFANVNPKRKGRLSGARWASFAASGEPFAWPQYLGKATVAPTLASRLTPCHHVTIKFTTRTFETRRSTKVLSDAETDELGISPEFGLHAGDCSFWQKFGTQNYQQTFGMPMMILLGQRSNFVDIKSDEIDLFDNAVVHSLLLDY